MKRRTWCRVLRIEPGREVRVFNGHGLERVARVELADKRGVVLRISATRAPLPNCRSRSSSLKPS